MNTEKYIGESAMNMQPSQKMIFTIKEGSVTTEKIADRNVTTEKVADKAITSDKLAEQTITDLQMKDNSVIERIIADEAVTTSKIASKAVETDKIANKSVTNEKLAVDSITTDKMKDKSVTTDKLAEASIETSKIKDGSITNDKMAQNAVNTEQVIDESIINSKLSKDAVSTEKLQNGSVTNDKVAKDSLTKDKFDPELRKAIDAATGLPDDLVTMIQDVDKSIAKLNDTIYPIVLELSINSNVLTMRSDIHYTVRSDNQAFIPDTLTITKKVNDGKESVLTNMPSAEGNLNTDIKGNREVFNFSVTKQGRTGKSTSQTKYLCYYGGNSASTMTDEILNTLNRVSTTGVSFNPKIATNDNDYIWLVVPSYLTISRVTSAGFDVTLASPQTITNSLGTFKAYRTANPLTAETWSLVIS